jgi:predicted HTH domain antitoxin
MIMSNMTLDYPEGLETAVQTTRAEFEAQIRFMAALKMFELGKLSSGKAAELAGISRGEFLDLCGRYQVSVFGYDPEDMEAELKQDMAAARQASS